MRPEPAQSADHPPPVRYVGNGVLAVEKLLTPSEVAELFRVDVKSVARWAKNGRLPCVTTPGGHRRYRAADVRALLTPDGET